MQSEFVRADARKLFEADPAVFRVAYGGWCATGVALDKKHGREGR